MKEIKVSFVKLSTLYGGNIEHQVMILEVSCANRNIYAPLGRDVVFNYWELMSGKAFSSRERAIEAAEWYCKMINVEMVLEN